MARPSIKQERRNQILDACEICLVRYGYAGTTLSRVAETAGLARPLIRHNLGNREDLLAATVERFISRSDEDMEDWLSELPRADTLVNLIDWLFDPETSDPHFIAVSGALGVAAMTDENLEQVLHRWNDRFVDRLATIVIDSNPGTEESGAITVAAGIAAIYLGSEPGTKSSSARPFRLQCKAAAIRLTETLEK
ncbi:MAG: TetR/AcrR family transcriptional regulator [Gammaproteobacteria bacterium]|nr:TetR/AcrR family transcriptional regulator [Gammaproteobacteria bacterium]